MPRSACVERRRVVDAVAHKRDALARRLKFFYELRLLLRPHFGKNIFSRNADLLGDARGGQGIVASDEINFQSLPLELFDDFRGVRFQRIAHGEQAEQIIFRRSPTIVAPCCDHSETNFSSAGKSAPGFFSQCSEPSRTISDLREILRFDARSREFLSSLLIPFPRLTTSQSPD